ncbi:hypothetical protein FisN_30Lh002 [Fistulifera solaris]|uniref:PDZ domain-containing protein n=1 Tax=Fistulifera solaris TaxID=1519565 RepID=A0A1Z5JC90_FISSO|nr:hypothetical protein FisN_30Lh002 [Fistulifera solaris]|eukprot:GAX11630.1 hypothetical protein FisN_30Lh002 [Fistulifera solaris]
MVYHNIAFNDVIHPSWMAQAAAATNGRLTSLQSNCHDTLSYRSPLDLQCKDHYETDCLQWRTLGFDGEQLADLLRNCPVSCGILCGTVEALDVTVSFEISKVASMLKASSTALFPVLTMKYMTSYVQSRTEGSQLILYEAELFQEKMLDRRCLNVRKLKESFSLAASLSLKAFAINLNKDLLELLLYSGFESDGYEQALRRSGDNALRDVVISPLHDALTRYVPKETTKDRKNPWVAFWLLLVGGFLVLCLLSYHRQRCDCIFSSPKLQDEGSSVIPSHFPSPTASSLDVFSNDRVCANSSFTQSAEASSDSISSSPSVTSQQYEDDHPLTGIVPPMILYQNIDDSLDDQSTDSESHNMFPSRRAVASPDLRAQFKSGRVKMDESMLVSPKILNQTRFQARQSPNGLMRHTQPHFFESSNDDRSSASLKAEMLRSVQNQSEEHYRPPSSYSHRRSVSLGECRRPPRVSSSSFARDLPNATPPINATLPYQNLNRIEPRELFETPERKRKTLPAAAYNSEPGSTSVWSGMPKTPRTRSKFKYEIVSPSIIHPSRGQEKNTVRVSRYGKLGIEFHYDSFGPVIKRVKDYSPLLGKVEIGDRMISIDECDTFRATHEDVAAIIAKKSNPMRLQPSMMNVVFLRGRSKVEETTKKVLLHSTAASKEHLVYHDDKPAILASSLRTSRYSFPLPQRNDLHAKPAEQFLSEDSVVTRE